MIIHFVDFKENLNYQGSKLSKLPGQRESCTKLEVYVQFYKVDHSNDQRRILRPINVILSST